MYACLTGRWFRSISSDWVPPVELNHTKFAGYLVRCSIGIMCDQATCSVGLPDCKHIYTAFLFQLWADYLSLVSFSSEETRRHMHHPAKTNGKLSHTQVNISTSRKIGYRDGGEVQAMNFIRMPPDSLRSRSTNGFEMRGSYMDPDRYVCNIHGLRYSD
jgi:hypothetical protein